MIQRIVVAAGASGLGREVALAQPCDNRLL